MSRHREKAEEIVDRMADLNRDDSIRYVSQILKELIDDDTSVTPVVEQGDTLLLDVVIAGLERRNVPSSMIDQLKKHREAKS